MRGTVRSIQTICESMLNFTVVVTLAILLSVMVSTSAQEAVDIQPAQREQAAPASATPQPSPGTDSIAAPNLPDPSQIDEIFKQTSLGKEADDRRLHLEWRELSNRVVSDPDVVAAKKAAQVAHTDLEKREKLRTYYNIYYGKMRALASSAELKAGLDRVKDAHLAYLNQPRVRPGPGAPSPTPTPERKKHPKKK